MFRSELGESLQVVGARNNRMSHDAYPVILFDAIATKRLENNKNGRGKGRLKYFSFHPCENKMQMV